MHGIVGLDVGSDSACILDAQLIAEWVRFGRRLPDPFAVDWRYEPLRRMTPGCGCTWSRAWRAK
jgi:hypothetical protein